MLGSVGSTPGLHVTRLLCARSETRMARTLIALLACLCLGVGAVAGVFLWSSGGDKRSSSDASSIVSGAARTAVPSTSGDALSRASGFDPDSEFQANELLLVNPPQNITDVARRLNYIIIERYSF